MKKVRVLAVQYKNLGLDINANLLKFDRIVRDNVYLKPSLVVFPEYALTGPLYGNYDMAFEEDNAIFSRLSELAEKYRINLVPGSFVRKSVNKRYNSTCFISSSGEISSFYNKQILWSAEKRFLARGSETKVFKTPIGNIALQICADLYSSRISHEYRSLKPDFIINIAMWSFEDIKACIRYVPHNLEMIQTESLAKARAIENMAYTLFCNYGANVALKAKTGRIYKETSIGNTMVINPYSEVIARTSTNKEEALFAEIDMAKCHWARY